MKKYPHYIIIVLFALSVVAVAQQSPYKGTPWPIPGLIEAEDYDNGGEGVAYHDVDTENHGGGYRPDEGVDLEESSEGNYNIGWIQPDEWTEYSVHVKQSGLYRLDVRVAASSQEGAFHLELDGADITGSMIAPVTGGWQEWQTISTNFYMPAGEQVLRWYSESSGYNVNNFNFVLLADSEPPTVTITSPKDKADFFLGDVITINAEASDPDGSVAKVEFYSNNVLIGQDASAPFSVSWTPAAADKYDLVAVAYDDKGVFSKSNKVDITVHFPNYQDGPDFSQERGFYSTAFDLTVSTTIAGAQIKYTVDGSDPASSSSAVVKSSPATIRVDPASRSGRGNTPAFTVRAIAVIGNVQQTHVQTHSFIFLEKVRTQRRPSSWPGTEINGQQLDYNIRREVVNDSRYTDVFDDALLDIPTISIVTDIDHLFDPATGIYVNAVEHGSDWERPTSVELIDHNGTPGFQVDAGLRIRGGWSRNDSNPKHAFRLFFREKYGYKKLKYPLFEQEGTDTFDKIDLRCSQNYSWAYRNSPMNTANRDVFSRDLQREMGQPYTRSRYYHLYLNGMYWGLYETQERSEASYAAEYYGGKRDDYDVIKVDAGYQRPYVLEATDGNLDGWKKVWDACVKGFGAAADYFALEGRQADGRVDPAGKKLVDIDNLIDYMTTIFHVGNYDAPVSRFSGNRNPNNFYTVYNREDNDGFFFLAHDSEHSLIIENGEGNNDGIQENRVNLGSRTDEQMYVDRFEKFHPQWLHFKLSQNGEYRLRFADHVYKHYFNNGVLAPERAAALFRSRAEMIDMAIIAESARWGSLSLSKHASWEPLIDEIADTYFDERWDIVLRQYIKEGLYPIIDPPVFKSGGKIITDMKVTVSPGYKLELKNDNGGSTSIYYTVDGTDPRNIGGAVSSSAQKADDSATITVRSTMQVMARLKAGSTWSALHAITLYVPEDMNVIKITEIHYKPLPDGDVSSKEFEFLEFKNVGDGPIDLGLAELIKGVSYTFPVGATLNAGEFFVLASNAQQFRTRYDFSPFGEFAGQLDNSGERIVLVTTVGDTILTVRYNDKAPWPEEPDSLGVSLVAAVVNPTTSPDDFSYWQASYWVHGSPGRDDKVATTVGKTENPDAYKLYQNYPNPFNAHTVIEFSVPEKTFVTVKVFDILGREAAVLLDERMEAGHHKINWDAKDVAAGLYFYKLSTTSGFQQTRKLIYVK